MASDREIEFAERAYRDGLTINEMLRTIGEKLVQNIEARKSEKASDGSAMYSDQSLADFERNQRAEAQRRGMSELEKSAIISRLDQSLAFAARFTDKGRTAWAREQRFTTALPFDAVRELAAGQYWCARVQLMPLDALGPQCERATLDRRIGLVALLVDEAAQRVIDAAPSNGAEKEVLAACTAALRAAEPPEAQGQRELFDNIAQLRGSLEVELKNLNAPVTSFERLVASRRVALPPEGPRAA